MGNIQNDNFSKIIPKFSWSSITCGENCWMAKEHDCKCSCGGKNHGIWKNGKTPIQRTSKIHGYLYKFVGFGTHSEISNLQMELLEKYGIARCYDYYKEGNYSHQSYKDQFRCRGDKDYYGFPLVSKNATINQCQKWFELESYKDKVVTKYDLYKYSIRILWELVEPPKPIKHLCGL